LSPESIGRAVMVSEIELALDLLESPDGVAVQR